MQSDRLRNVLSLAVVCGFTLMLAGTSKPGSSSPSPSPNPAPINTQTGTGAPGAGTDVDLAAVNALVTCPKSGHPACRLLTDFALGTPYTDTPVGNNTAVWYGETIGLAGAGNLKKEFFFIQVEGTPEGVNASPRSLINSNAKETKEATDLVYALRNNKPLPQNNGALAFVKTTAAASNMRKLVKSTGNSTILQGESPRLTYFRRLGNRLIVIEYDGSPIGHGSNATYASGWIAETWLVSR